MASFMAPMGQMGAPMGMPMKHPGDPNPEDEPSNKKMRNEDSLIPEDVFITRNTVSTEEITQVSFNAVHQKFEYIVFLQNPVTFKIMVPSMPEKTEWRLNGQLLTYTLPLSESIASLKAKVQDDVGMQPAKQKLYYDVSI